MTDMNGLTDIHQHILWGMDDGPRRSEEMFAMLREARAKGIKRIAATPHAAPGLRPFDTELYWERLDEARCFCRANGLDIELMSGCEAAWTYRTVEALRVRQIPTLNDSEYALIELWQNITWSEVRDISVKLLRAGFVPVFAHIERYRCFMWQPGHALDMKDEMPVCYQMNADTVLDEGGPIKKRFLRVMLEEQAVDAIASDCHGTKERPQLLDRAHRALIRRCGRKYADALVNFAGW